MWSFVAIDFETASQRRESACAVALVRVQGSQVAQAEERLIRPPARQFRFTHIHGITWEQVKEEPTFGALWPRLAPLVQGTAFLAAHNAPFDRNVLAGCCEMAGLPVPSTPFLCTVRLARGVWGIRPTRLPNVCERLGIPLQHHRAGSDARACAEIVLAALRTGVTPAQLERYFC